MHGDGRRGYACKYASTAATRLVMATMTSTSSLCTLVTPDLIAQRMILMAEPLQYSLINNEI